MSTLWKVINCIILPILKTFFFNYSKNWSYTWYIVENLKKKWWVISLCKNASIITCFVKGDNLFSLIAQMSFQTIRYHRYYRYMSSSNIREKTTFLIISWWNLFFTCMYFFFEISRVFFRVYINESWVRNEMMTDLKYEKLIM